VTDFVTVGTSIAGVTIHGNNVYVCNQSRIKGYDLTSAAEIMNVTITGSTFLNDLAVDNSGIMYISDFSTRRIYKLNTNTSEYWIYVPNTTNQPNGVYIDTPRNRLLICCWGANAPIKAVNFSDSSIANIITTPYSNCDGITLDRNENVFVSTWGIQSVVKYDINFTDAPVVVVNGLSNPADIYINVNADTLAVPNAGNNTVTFHFLNTSVSVNQTGYVVPNSFKLYQNYPNPFNPSTNLEFAIAKSGFVSLKIYDGLGKEVLTLVNEILTPGSYNYQLLTVNYQLSSGMYFYKLETDNFSETKRMMLLK
jgi:hypothetical protein